MAKRYFTVTGSGQFPYDMLRYDECWPLLESEIPMLAQDWAGGMRTIQIVSNNNYAPTIKRWESFTWKVNIK